MRFNSHCYVLCADGAFYGNGSFKVVASFATEPLEKTFQYKALGGAIEEREDDGKCA
jgi:hypothetical protein